MSQLLNDSSACSAFSRRSFLRSASAALVAAPILTEAHFARAASMSTAAAVPEFSMKGIYLDANENGRYDAGEAGAANVTVILDGRFSTRTDANGRYDFPAVAAGRHVITVQPDNLPLPWTLLNQGRTEVEVTTRDRVDVNIGAMRLK